MDIDVKKVREEIMREVKTLPPGVEALKRLAYLRENIDSAVDDYMNTLNLLSDTAYEDRRHFLLELIQNADDAGFASERPQIKFIINSDSIELNYNERGFDAEDVIAITGAGVSTKKGKESRSHSFIGEKGIGFKSVFALASMVEIESPPWHFLLRKNKPIVPEIIEGKKLPAVEGTRLRVFLDKPETVKIVADELLRFVQGQIESFLFLQKLSSFVVIDQREEPHQIYELNLDPANREGMRLCLSADPGEYIREYALYKEDVEFDAKLVKERWDKLNFNEAHLKRKIVVAALMDTTEYSMPEGRLFCFLPTEVKLPIPIYLQVDGHTVASREKLHDPERNNWNRHLLNVLPGFLLRAILSWREDEQLSKSLINFIPADCGTDQLAPIFEIVINDLRQAQWVLADNANTGRWVKPEQALIVTDYWSKVFAAHPIVKKDAESVLRKYFVCQDWLINKKWRDKLAIYGINEISEENVFCILEEIELPEDLQKDVLSLTRLYKYLLQLPSMRSDKIDCIETRKRLLSAKIFPIDEGLFSSLKGNNSNNKYEDKAFWLAGRSSRKTGMEGIIESKIIDTEYTRNIDSSGTITEERKKQIYLINERNDALRKLLQKLEIKELNEDSLLTELQIPWLCSPPKIATKSNIEERLKVLSAIFEVYRSKRVVDDDYSHKLLKLKNAYFWSEEKNFVKLKDLLLPSALQIYPEDRIYNDASLSGIYLPSTLFSVIKEKDKKYKLKEEWRAFLIACGARTTASFEYVEKNYANPYEFKSRNAKQHKCWLELIGNDYTSNNSVKIQTVQIDNVTIKLACSENGCSEAFVKNLYKSWFAEFGKRKSEEEQGYAFYYRDKPLSGFFVAEYFRRHQRRILIEDADWSGIPCSIVPLMDLTGKSVRAGETFCLPTGDYGLNNTLNLFSIVLEDTDSGKKEVEKQGVYHPLFIKSLKIRRMTASVYNKLWSQVDDAIGNKILKSMYELLELDLIEVSGLQLYDKKSKQLRLVTDFKLGKELIDGIPLIEEQYGEDGKRLGELIGLEIASSTPSYKDLFIVMLEPFSFVSTELRDKLSNILNAWHKWSIRDKEIIRSEFSEAVKEYNLESPPVIVFNDQIIYKQLNKAGIKVIMIDVEEDRLGLFKKAAAELGLLSIDTLGKIVVENESNLTHDEMEYLSCLVTEYCDSLDLDELSKFNICFSQLDNKETWATKIKRAGSLDRIIDIEGDIVKVRIDLPYFDAQRKQFFTDKNFNIEIILAHLLSYFGFTRHKHALQDIKSLSTKRPSLNLPQEESEDSFKSNIYDTFNDSMTVTAQTIAEEIKDNLIDDRQAPAGEEKVMAWHTGVAPEEEEILRSSIADAITNSLQAGPANYIKKIKERQKTDNNTQTKTYDPGAIDPKMFLLNEYDGRCQACATMLTLSSGRKLFEIFRIKENKGEVWWCDRQFNVLCLCPNCHAIFKHGGGLDLSSIFVEANKVINHETFPIEVAEHAGDYYVIPILFNGKAGKLVVSTGHMSHFTALLESAEAVVTVGEEIINDEDAKGNNVNIIEVGKSIKRPPGDFTNSCIKKVQEHLSKSIIKQSQALYSSSDNTLQIICLISSGRDLGEYIEYWFGLRTKQKAALESAKESYLALCCGSESLILLIPYSEIRKWLDSMSISGTIDNIKHWNINIVKRQHTLRIRLRSDYPNIDITEYVIN